MTEIVGHLINGEVRTTSERTLDVFNPATSEVTKQVAMASRATVEEAIASAQAAFPAWRNTPPMKRARIMFRFKQLLEENADEICRLIGDEHGKIIHDAQGELQRGIENVEFRLTSRRWCHYGCIPQRWCAETVLFLNRPSVTLALPCLLLSF